MPVYLAVSLRAEKEPLRASVLAQIPAHDRYELPNNAGWLINYPGTSLELSNQIGVTGQPPNVPSVVGSTIVTAINSYYGRGSADMWDWIKTRMEA